MLTTLLAKDQIRDNSATSAKKQIEANLEWVNKRQDAIEKWLNALEVSADASSPSSAHVILSSFSLLIVSLLVCLQFFK